MTTLPPLQGLGIRNVHSATTGHTYDLEGIGWGQSALSKRGKILYKAWPTGTWHGKGYFIPFPIWCTEKSPIWDCPISTQLVSGKASRLVSVHRRETATTHSPGHCVRDECLEAVSWFWLQTLFVVEKLFCPREFSLSSNFLARESWTSSCVLFPLWDFFTGSSSNTKILQMCRQ